MPIITAIVVSEYNSNSVEEATVMAKAWEPASLEFMRTKNTIREITVSTMTRMPQKRPLLAREQSTE